MYQAVLILSAFFYVCFAQNPCTQPGVVFCNGFEGTDAELSSAWGGNVGSNLVIADPGPFNTAGNQILRLGFSVIHAKKILPQGYDKLYARWYQKFPAGFNFTNGTNPSHYGFTFSSGPETGKSAYYPNGCTDTDWMILEAQWGNTTNSKQHWYVYHPGKTTQWGDIYWLDAPIVADKWYCNEAYIDLGTPTPDTTGANGALDFWMDGTHYGHGCGSWPPRCGGIWFRNCPSLKVTTVDFMSMNANNPQPGMAVLYDDLVVSTLPIGCGKRVGYFQIPLGISTSALNSGKKDSIYYAFLKAEGGAAPYSWTITSGSLPPGLALVQPTGRIFGTPTQAGTFTFTVHLVDLSNPPQTADKQFTIQILSSTNLLASSDGKIWEGISARVRSDRLLVRFAGKTEKGTVRLNDVQGRLVWIRTLKAENSVLESPALPNGLYVGNIGNGHLEKTFRFAIVR